MSANTQQDPQNVFAGTVSPYEPVPVLWRGAPVYYHAATGDVVYCHDGAFVSADNDLRLLVRDVLEFSV